MRGETTLTCERAFGELHPIAPPQLGHDSAPLGPDVSVHVRTREHEQVDFAIEAHGKGDDHRERARQVDVAARGCNVADQVPHPQSGSLQIPHLEHSSESHRIDAVVVVHLERGIARVDEFTERDIMFPHRCGTEGLRFHGQVHKRRDVPRPQYLYESLQKRKCSVGYELDGSEIHESQANWNNGVSADYEDVSGVWVGVVEPMPKDHARVALEEERSHSLAFNTGLVNFIEVVDRNALNELRSDHGGAAELRDDLRDHDAFVSCEVLAGQPHILGFVAVVHFVQEHVREFSQVAAEVNMGKEPARQAHGIAQRAKVHPDLPLHVWVQEFDCNLASIADAGHMDLSERCRGQRLARKLGIQVFRLAFEFLNEAGADRGVRADLHVIRNVREDFRELRIEKVADSRKVLCRLDVDAAPFHEELGYAACVPEHGTRSNPGGTVRREEAGHIVQEERKDENPYGKQQGPQYPHTCTAARSGRRVNQFRPRARMIIAVTGGNGFLGRALRERLLEARRHIRVLTRTPPPVPESDKLVEYHRADLATASPADLDTFLHGCSVLVHMAGIVSRSAADEHRMMELHVEGTRKLLALAERSHIKRVILLSTSGTVAISKSPRIIGEEEPYAIELAGRWPYYMSKIYQEKTAMEWARRTGTELIALRPSLVLGPGDRDLSSCGDVLHFLSGDVPVIPGGGLSFVDVRDVALACQLAIDASLPGLRETPRTFLLGSANWSFRRFFRVLERLSGIKGPRTRVGRRLGNLGANLWNSSLNPLRSQIEMDPVAVDMAGHYWYLDAKPAQDDLGLTFRDPDTTLSDTVAYLRQAFPEKVRR